MKNQKPHKSLSLAAIKTMFANGARLMKMIWRDKPGAVIAMIAVFIVVSSAPFLQSGARGLLINKLVGIAGSHTIPQSL